MKKKEKERWKGGGVLTGDWYPYYDSYDSMTTICHKPHIEYGVISTAMLHKEGQSLDAIKLTPPHKRADIHIMEERGAPLLGKARGTSEKFWMKNKGK